MTLQGFQNLVVGIDFSPYSKLVVKEAQLLANKLQVPVTYVHVAKDVRIYRDVLGATRPGVEERFFEKVEEFYKLPEDSDIRIEFGSAPEKIIKIAQKKSNPLIVVGSRGGSPVAKFFIGSTAETLAFTSKIPVWIHRGKQTKIPKTFLLPSDLSTDSDKTIQSIEPLRQGLKARLQLHHVYEEPTAYLGYPEWGTLNQQMKKQDNLELADYTKKHSGLKITRSTGAVAQEIQKKSKDFDLLALTPKKAGRQRMVFGGVMTKIIRHVEKPVLVLP